MKKEINVKKWVFNNWHLIVLLVIFLTAFWFRSFPGRFGELQALDPFQIFRMSEHLVNNNLQFVENDILRYYPTGVPSWEFELFVPTYMPAITYVALSTIGLNMPYLHFAIIWPAVLGALASVVMYFIGREMFGKKAGLFAAFFLAASPAFITRTSAGFFEKEPIAGLFTLLSITFFIFAFKKDSWRYGILSGLSLAIVSGTWGGVRYFYLIFSGFLFTIFLAAAVLLLLDNLFKGFGRFSDSLEKFLGMSMVKAFAPTILLGILLFKIFPMGVSLTSFEITFSFAVLGILAIRNVVDRFRLVSTEKIRQVIPAMLLIGIVVLLIGSMFSDVLMTNITQFSRVLGVQRDVISTTVAENSPGSWSNVVAVTGTTFSGAVVGVLSPLAPYAALWIFMILGAFLLLYRLYRTNEWMLLFPLVWLLSAIFGVFYAVRLTFLLGPPAALMGGFFMAWFVERFFRLHTDRQKKRESPRKFGLLPILIIAVVAVVVVVNFATGYVYSQGLGPSICMIRSDDPCVTVNEDGTLNLNDQQPWYQAMEFLSGTGQDNSVLSWWDFGYWFQTRGNKPTVADGGNLGGGHYGIRDHEIAEWFTSPPSEWDDWEDWMKEYVVGYILMDYTLPGKYGAISKIASNGEQIVGFLEFQRAGIYPSDNYTTYVFANGPYEIWLPFNDDSTLAGTPTFLVKQNGQYYQKSYINNVCTKDNGIIRTGEQTPSIDGCVAITDIGIFYVPPEAMDTIFVNLMFMEGYGLPIEQVFDNQLIQIYKVNYQE